MVDYELFSGEGRTHPILAAVIKGVVGSLDSMSGNVCRAVDYYNPDVKDVHKIGEITVSGDIELLPPFFAFSD